jgi:hypothetical protein
MMWPFKLNGVGAPAFRRTSDFQQSETLLQAIRIANLKM